MKYKATTIFLITLSIFTIVSLSVVGYLYASSNPSIARAIDLATTVKPETFTELYFQDHLNLPSMVVSNKDYSFKFTVHNLENKDMVYPYEVYLDIGEEKLFIEKNAVSIKKDAYKTITEEFLLKGQVIRAKIVVNLTSKNQQIDFWINGGGAK